LQISILAALLAFAAGVVVAADEPELTKQREQFGQQLFRPRGGYVLEMGKPLPPLVWDQPELVADLTEDASIRTIWFDESFHEVSIAHRPGRYFAYGVATGPGKSTFRRAVTCVGVDSERAIQNFAQQCFAQETGEASVQWQSRVAETVETWRSTENGAVQLAAMMDSRGVSETRPGQWQMENATRHVRLKRKLMGLGPSATVEARRLKGQPSPVLRYDNSEETGITADQTQALKTILDEWYAESQQPTAVVVAQQGVVVFAGAWGELDGQPVTVNTPMLLHSAMKPLIGLQLAMYVDRGLIELDQPIGDFLPGFDRPADQQLTFRAAHAHLTGIYFPWPLAFSRLFYFQSWQESLIAHQPREWDAGSNYRYGVVGVILAVRSLELISGLNYWEAMEKELFEPLGVRDMLPGGTGFSAEDLARIGLLLDNHGRNGSWELFTEKTYRQIIPGPLQKHFPAVERVYGVGLQSYASRLGRGSYGHGGGCGTQLIVDPHHHLVFAMVRNDPGDDYQNQLERVTSLLRSWNAHETRDPSRD